jgi:hypothetical protein
MVEDDRRFISRLNAEDARQRRSAPISSLVHRYDE